MKKLVTAITVIGLTACHQTKPIKDTKILDFGAFTMETPQTWTKIERRGADSYVGAIAIDNRDTLAFDLGWYSNKLYEYDPTILDSSMMTSIDTSRMDMNEVFFVKNRMRADPDRYRRNNVSWDTIDGREVKIVYPRRSGIGTTGVYIDNLWGAEHDVDRFNLYGTNLTPENQKRFLEALRTLKFRKKK